MSDVGNKKLTTICEILQSAAQKTRVLSHLGWPASVRDDFFSHNAKELPRVNYPDYNAAPVLDLIAQARTMMRQIDNTADSSVSEWLERQAVAVETSAKMLMACGTPSFYETLKRALRCIRVIL